MVQMTDEGLIYISRAYNVPAEIGQRIRFQGEKEGEIIGSHNAHLKVRFDGYDKDDYCYLHPTWMVEYIENDEKSEN